MPRKMECKYNMTSKDIACLSKLVLRCQYTRRHLLEVMFLNNYSFLALMLF